MNRKEINNQAKSRIRARVKHVALVMRFDIDKLEYCYNKQYQMWLLNESHDKEYLGDLEDFRYEFDKKGFITNVEFSGKTRNGFNLTEKDFLANEIKRIDSIDIDYLGLDAKKYITHIRKFFEEKVETKTEKLKQEENEYPTNIFTSYTGYKIWQRLFDEFEIEESSLTDLSFMFEQMKRDDFIHSTFRLVDLYDWLNEKYAYAVGRIKFTDPKANVNKTRMSAYNAIKENIKQP